MVGKRVKKFGQGSPLPLFRQCPKETFFFMRASLKHLKKKKYCWILILSHFYICTLLYFSYFIFQICVLLYLYYLFTLLNICRTVRKCPGTRPFGKQCCYKSIWTRRHIAYICCGHEIIFTH